MKYRRSRGLYHPVTYAFDELQQWPQTADEEACDAPSALADTSTVTFGKPNVGIQYHYIHQAEYFLLSLPCLSLP